MGRIDFYHEMDDRDHVCVCGHSWPCPETEEFLSECSKLCLEIDDKLGASEYAIKARLARRPAEPPRFWMEM